MLNSIDIHPIILFDGVCNLCCASVQFIILRDPQAIFRFTSLQSELGIALQTQYGLMIKETPDSLVLIEKGKVYQKSSAALKIASKLSGFWFLLGIFWIIPSFIRDSVYTWVANNRYRWYGKQGSCWLPTPQLRRRFL